MLQSMGSQSRTQLRDGTELMNRFVQSTERGICLRNEDLPLTPF